MTDCKLVIPPDFDEGLWDTKGFYSGATLSLDDRSYRLNFYDPVRLGQTIEDELRSGAMFFEPNLVVVPSVTRRDMERAAALLVEIGQIASLAPS